MSQYNDRSEIMVKAAIHKIIFFLKHKIILLGISTKKKIL